MMLKKDWQLIMGYSPKMIYYAHANEKIIPLSVYHPDISVAGKSLLEHKV